MALSKQRTILWRDVATDSSEVVTSGNEDVFTLVLDIDSSNTTAGEISVLGSNRLVGTDTDILTELQMLDNSFDFNIGLIIDPAIDSYHREIDISGYDRAVVRLTGVTGTISADYRLK